MDVLIPPLHRRGGADVPASVAHVAAGVATRLRNDPVRPQFVKRAVQVEGWTVHVTMLDGEVTVSYTPPVQHADEQLGSMSHDLFSGVVDAGRIRRPTEEETAEAQVAKRPAPVAKLLSFLPSQNTVADYPDRKFVANTPVEFAELAIQPRDQSLRDPPVLTGPAPRYIASQYKRMRPTHFTGAMRRLVQYRTGMTSALELSGGRLGMRTAQPGDDSHPAAVPYSFGWGVTHGLFEAADKTLWVIEISTVGVRAWVLPVLRRSTTGAVELIHSGATEASADELQVVADALYEGLTPTQRDVYTRQGWLPVGGDPIDGAAFAEAETAGMACRPADAAALAPFYDRGEPYFAACGWAFSYSGGAAVNTCFAEDIGTTYRRARYMRLSFGGGAVLPDGGYAPVTCSVAAFDEQWLRGIGSVYFPKESVLPGGPPSLSVIQTRPRSWPSQPPGHPPPGSTDVVVYAYFDGDAEVRVRYSVPEREAEIRPVLTTRTQGSMACGVGSTTTSSVREYVGKPGGPYTSHRDDRRLPEGESSVATSSSRFLGWSGQAATPDSAVDCWWTCCKVGAIENTYNGVTTTSRGFGQAVYIPAYDREAYLFMSWEKATGVVRDKGRSGSIKTSSSYRKYFVYDRFWIRPIFHYGQTVIYILVIPPGRIFTGRFLSPGNPPNPADVYSQYNGGGPTECDPPEAGDACAGPLPDGCRDVPVTPRITATSTRKTAAVEETVTLHWYRSRRQPRLLYEATNQYGPYDRTLSQELTPYNAEGLDGVLGSFATCDVFNPSVSTVTVPYLPITVSEVPGLPAREAFSTTFIGVPNGIRD